MSKIVLNRFLMYFLILCIVASGSLTVGLDQASAQTTKAQPLVPELLITELVPDSTNVGTADGYEFIEVYNNTDQEIDFSNYKIRYRYLESDTLWAHVPDKVTIPSGETLVFWIINAQNAKSTIDDFNGNYGTNLTENTQVVKIFSGGMSNSRMRELLIVTNTGQPVVSAFYNDGEVQNGEDLGIFYKYPENGSIKMQRISYLQHKATPGSLAHSIVPDSPVHIDTSQEPTVINWTDTTSIAPGENLEISAQAHDQRRVTTLELSYRTDGQGDYQTAQLVGDEQQGYRYTIPYLELLGKKELEYFFTVSNTFNEVESEKYTVDLTGDGSSIRLNVEEQQTVSGVTYLRGAADGAVPADLQMTVAGQPVQGTPALEYAAYFLFEADGIDDGINTVTVGNDILYQTEPNIDGYQTIVAPIDPQWLTAGPNTITLRAGDNDKTYFDHDKPTGNLDDFNARNIRLLLGDGTVITDPNNNNPSQIYDLGDDGRFLPFVPFTFAIPADKLNAVSYGWDTAGLADGPYTISLTADNQPEVSVEVLVDNNGPEIDISLEDGRTYRDNIVINVTALDAVSDVENVTVNLDGKPIAVPFHTSSAELTPGEHKLEVTAVDTHGNRSERTVAFHTPEEHPNAPVLVSPTDRDSLSGLTAELKVQVSDPTDDPLEVSFHQAYMYNALSDEHVRIYKNATDQEPPKEQTPAGETELTKEERVSIAESNDQYVTVDSTNQFPYIRFEVELQHQVEPGDQIEVNWEGHTLEGRKVTMYGFNHATNQWTAIANHIAKSEDDFTLAGELAVDDYVRNGQVDVIVQDEIPTRDKYDYTFAWVSDTQFLTELYPHIQQQQFDWIVDSIDEMNIKYLFHTGDIVNDPTAEYQWKRADEYMKLLENANLPHGVLAGNHDVGSYDWDYTTYSQYFGEARYMNQPYYGGSYKDNRGHYDLISVEGNDFIMMYMGWGIEDEDIAWMNEVLAEHPDRIAFLSFHDYMLANGNRSAIGNKLFEQVVVPNPNVVAVLSGHYTGASLKQDNLDDNGDGTPDRTVYQMLADYQGHAEGGMGFMRLLHIDQDHNQIYVNTYSPYKDEYNYYKDGRDEFIINLDLEPHVKRVATDTIQVNHLRAATIGDIQQVASGSEATQSWSDLQPNSAYAWYAIAEDAFGGRTVSDVWTFTTNEQGDLAAPTNLTALEVSSTSVKLGWDPVNTEPGQSIQYHVYQDGARMASVTDSVYDAGELTPDTRYEFYVTAEDEQGHESAPSEVVEVYTAAEVDPDAPVWGTGELTAADISTNQVTLEWPEAASNAGVEGYRIYMNQGTEPVITVTNDVYTHSVTGLDQGTRYHFTVKAYNKAGESAGLHKTITTAIDRSELTALIEAAQQKLDSTREGNAPGEYPAVARTQFRSAIALAVSVANQADATADEVESAQLALEAAIRTYAASVMPYPVDPPSTNPPAMETDFRSGNAGLKSLEIVIDGVIAALTPAFSEQITSYRLATESSSIKLRFDVAHNGAKVMLGNEVLNPDREIALKEGDNVLELVIIAENGNKKSYTLTIHRKAKEDTEGQKPEPQPVPELEDIKGHWATTAIEEALTLGIVNGYPDGSFKPDRSVTRAEFIVMMAKALQGTAMNELSSDFSDSETVGAWAKNALQWALDEGIVNGYHDNSLRPNLVVNRAEMAVMIVRYLGLTSLQSETGFRDQDQIPAWASKEITAAAENGIVNGRSGNRFAPSEVTTRAEAVMVILRMLEQVQK